MMPALIGAAAALCALPWCRAAEPADGAAPVVGVASAPATDAAGRATTTPAVNMASRAPIVDMESAAAMSDLSPRKKPEDRVQEAAAIPAAKDAKGFIGDSHLNLALRNYAEYLEVEPGPNRHAWVQSLRANFESGYTAGEVGYGIDLAPYAAVKLDGGNGTRNMVYVGPNGTGADTKMWAYLGGYALKARMDDVVIKYGLQSIVNPFLAPYDIRALPPSFRGVTIAANPSPTLALTAGSIDSMIVRGADYRQPLTTAYGGINFGRLDYAGADWQYSSQGKLSLYMDRARDVWNQYYGALAHSIDGWGGIKWTGNANLYVTRDEGGRLEGSIRNQAYSVSLIASAGASSVMVGYQRVVGDQFFDFLQETSGIYLSNSMGTDYNAPHEQSLQLHYKLDGAALRMPGFQGTVWGISGWGANGASGAAKYVDPADPLYARYWKNGSPISGTHQELGAKLTYTLQQIELKGTRVALLLIAHNISPLYPSKRFRDLRITVDVPVHLF